MKKDSVIKKINVLPQHIAFILDGNRRWAKKNNKSSNFGHKHGAYNIQNICNLCIKYKIKYLTLYCLSIENLNRSKKELKFLFSCIKYFLEKKNIEKMHKNKINLNIIGDLNLLPNNIKNIAKLANKNQIKKPKLNVQACICYSGRNEILNGVKNIFKNIKNGLINFSEIEKINEKDFEKYIFTGNLPDVDLMIRTGGDIRISNFLLWKLSYAELYFCDTFFPDFDEKNFLLALYDFQNRKRRYGV